MVGNLEMTELCHRCRRVPFVTTVSDGAREVALCLGCLAALAEQAERWQLSDDSGKPRERPKSGRAAWRRVIERVGKE